NPSRTRTRTRRESVNTPPRSSLCPWQLQEVLSPRSRERSRSFSPDRVQRSIHHTRTSH
ncbi:hypothetical protein BGZ91_002470, partial [Linnemannia elongata]